MNDITAAGQKALDEALRLFNLDVYDPPANMTGVGADRSRKVIDEILTTAGWVWEVPFKGPSAVEWCGLFAAACWHAAGIDDKWLATYFASTYRLDLWGRYETFNTTHPNPKPADGSPLRLMACLNQASSSLPFQPMPGDILMIGDGTPPMGQHITLVESYDPVAKVFTTISGNGAGTGPDGKHRVGIVRAQAHLGGGGYCARRLIRPAASDVVDVLEV